MRKELFAEMIAVGILAIVFQLFIYMLLSGEFPSLHFNKMILGAFLSGASLHFSLEIAGLNEYWCRTTYT
jgi:multisubunit Na+/H+ antiporter MnhE subunit